MPHSYAVCHKHADVALDHLIGEPVLIRHVENDDHFKCHCHGQAAYYLMVLDMDTAVREYVQKMATGER